VVVISDSDEASRAFILPGERISPNLPVRNRPETLAAAVAERFPEKAFKFHAVVRPTNADTCSNSSNIDARKAPIYQQMVQSTGGQLVNICRDRDRSEIQQLANQIRSTGHNYSLRCVPTDENGDGQPDVQVSFLPQPTQPIQTVVTGQTVRFQPEPAAGTQVTLTYRCP
jgi:disulfide oxidoreductase YuzD